jgi:hypothetical protein
MFPSSEGHHPRSRSQPLAVFLVAVVLLRCSTLVEAQCGQWDTCGTCSRNDNCGWCYELSQCLSVDDAGDRANGALWGCGFATTLNTPLQWVYKPNMCDCAEYNNRCQDCVENGCGLCRTTGTCVNPYPSQFDGTSQCDPLSYEACPPGGIYLAEFIISCASIVAAIFIFASGLAFQSLMKDCPCNLIFLSTVICEFFSAIMKVTRFSAIQTNAFGSANPANIFRDIAQDVGTFLHLLGQSFLGLMYLSIAINFRKGTAAAWYVLPIGETITGVAGAAVFIYYEQALGFDDNSIVDEILFGSAVAMPVLIGLGSILYVMKAIGYMSRKGSEKRAILSRLTYVLILLGYQGALVYVLFTASFRSRRSVLLNSVVVGAAASGFLEMIIFILIERLFRRWRVRLFGVPLADVEAMKRGLAVSLTRIRRISHSNINSTFSGPSKDGSADDDDPAEKTLAEMVAEERQDPYVHDSIADLLSQMGPSASALPGVRRRGFDHDCLH